MHLSGWLNKNSESSNRVCMDYRWMNTVTLKKTLIRFQGTMDGTFIETVLTVLEVFVYEHNINRNISER